MKIRFSLSGSYSPNFGVFFIIGNNMKKLVAVIVFIILLAAVTTFVQNKIHKKMKNILKLFFKRITIYKISLVIFKNIKFGK